MKSPEEENLAALIDYYGNGQERDRLDRPKGTLELVRTKELIMRRLPKAPAVVADIGGGPGRYSLWLAQEGYRVEHRDLMDVHVTQLNQAAAAHPEWDIHAFSADACALDLPTESVDAVLLLGPLYHLPERTARVQALKEARRVVRPGGPVFAAAISRWSPRLDAIVGQRLYREDPEMLEDIVAVEETGWMRPLFRGAFTGYTHRPEDLAEEIGESGLTLTSLDGIEGPGYLLSELAERMANLEDRAVLLESARALEAVPELLGLSPHLLATAVR